MWRWARCTPGVPLFRLFPLFAVDADQVARAEVVAAEAAPIVRKPVLEKADLASRMLRARR